LIESETLRPVALPAWATGSSVTASARNLTGSTSNSIPVVLNGESLRPVSPVTLTAVADGVGGLDVRWTRRSRLGWAWLDEIDVPLGESVEAYRVTVMGPLDSIELETAVPSILISAAQLGPIGTGPATLQVRQIGDAGVSRPAECTVTI
jgi:hypothetical protein